MKARIITTLLSLIFTLNLYSGEIKIISVNGTVLKRHGIQENWTRAAVGDILKPEDSIELGLKSSAVILIDGSKKIIIPENIIIDVSDFRILSQEEVLLSLAMETIRSVPDRGNTDQPEIPKVTTVHGSNKEDLSHQPKIPVEAGYKQLNGTRVLYENGYLGTCVLRTRDLTKMFPSLSAAIEAKLRSADALEKLGLKLEAFEEYIRLEKENLTSEQRSFISMKINELRNSNK